MNIHMLLEMAAEASPERVAIGSGQSGITYETLLHRARQAALYIDEQDVQTITYCGLNHSALPVALFAASFAGKPFTPLNYRLPDANLKQLLGRSAPSLVLCDTDNEQRLEGVLNTKVVVAEGLLLGTGCSHYSTSLALPDSDQEVAVVLFTSGTTAEPKAAILRHANMASYILSSLEFQSASESEATLISVPPYHIAGMAAILSSVYIGRRMVQLPAFSPEVWIDTVISESITHAMVVPTMLKRILEVIAERDIELPSLQSISYGGGRMPRTIIERAMDLLPTVEFVNAYGLTETSSTIAILDPQDHHLARSSTDPTVRRRLSSVGKPLPHIELEIRDGRARQVDSGEVGEIWVRGDQVSGEYKDKKAIQDDGWFPTNDAGWIDESGYLYVEGRLDDVIVRGGENMSPSEIEDVLIGNPGISDVAVLGLPDEEWGEKIVAVLVCSDAVDVEHLKATVRSRLRSSRVPERFIFKDHLPYNEMGKLMRRQLRQGILADS